MISRWAQGLLASSMPLMAPAAAPPPATESVLYISATTNTWTRQRLIDLGYNLIDRTANNAGTQYTPSDLNIAGLVLVVVDESIISGDLVAGPGMAELQATELPILFQENLIADDLLITSVSGFTGSNVEDNILITTAGTNHPITESIEGGSQGSYIEVSSSAQTKRYLVRSALWNDDKNFLGTKDTDPNLIFVAAWDKNDRGHAGNILPGPRVFFPVITDGDSSGNPALLTEGRQLYDNSVSWCLDRSKAHRIAAQQGFTHFYDFDDGHFRESGGVITKLTDLIGIVNRRDLDAAGSPTVADDIRVGSNGQNGFNPSASNRRFRIFEPMGVTDGFTAITVVVPRINGKSNNIIQHGENNPDGAIRRIGSADNSNNLSIKFGDGNAKRGAASNSLAILVWYAGPGATYSQHRVWEGGVERALVSSNNPNAVPAIVDTQFEIGSFPTPYDANSLIHAVAFGPDLSAAQINATSAALAEKYGLPIPPAISL